MRIGCSGYTYKHWERDFYPNKSDFKFYSERFNCVELNSTFYGHPTDSTVRKWREQAPADFVYTWKASKYITHMKKLRDCIDSVDKMMVTAEILNPAVVLFQLPPMVHYDQSRLDDFLDVLFPGKYAFEFRHASWYNDKVFTRLQEREIALVIHDHKDGASPWEYTSDWTYVRLHGPNGFYGGSYSTEDLSKFADNLRMREGFVFFDNDINAVAPRDALRFKRYFNEFQ